MVMPFRSDAVLADCAIEGTDGVGRAIAEYPLGTLPFRAQKCTVYAYWSSEEPNGKSVLGYGWRIPWFESRIYQVSRDCLVMHSPDGIVRKFWLRKEDGSNLWRGRHGSGCVTNGREVRFYWRLKENRPDLVFRDGRLMKMNLGGQIVEFYYSESGMFEQLMCEGKVLCQMKTNGKNHRIRIVSFTDGNRAEAILAPVRIGCQNPNGQVGFQERMSVVQLKFDGRKRRILHGLTKDGRATFSDGERNYVYDLKSRQILSLNDWTYTVTEIDTRRRNAHILRKRPDGEVEEEYVNFETGMRVSERKGWRRVWRVFTSGKNLHGKRRWMEETYPQGFVTRTEYAYDEKGALAMTLATDKKSGQTTETRFTETGRATYYKITLKNGHTIEHWFDAKDGKLLRTRSGGDEKSDCDYLYTSTGKQVASVRNGKIVSRFVPNAEEFMNWKKDLENGVKRPEPQIKTQEEIAKEEAKNTEFMVLIAHSDEEILDLNELRVPDTPAKMSIALTRFYERMYLPPMDRYEIDVVGQGSRMHHLEIGCVKESGVDLDPGNWRVLQQNVLLMERLDGSRFRILPEGRFTKGSNDLHLAVEVFPTSMMVTVTGRVIDEQGCPQSGVRVKGTFLPRLELVTYPECWAETDSRGRYRFEYLPPVRIHSLLSYLLCGDFGKMRSGDLYEGANKFMIETVEGARVEVRLISASNVKLATKVIALLREKRNLLDSRTREIVKEEVKVELPKSESNVIYAPDLALKK